MLSIVRENTVPSAVAGSVGGLKQEEMLLEKTTVDKNANLMREREVGLTAVHAIIGEWYMRM